MRIHSFLKGGWALLFVSATLVAAQNSATATKITFTEIEQPLNSENQAAVVAADFAHAGRIGFAATAWNEVQIAVPYPRAGYFWHEYPTGTGADQLVTGDFNHDGNLDLVVGNGAETTLTILLGNGDGSFRPAPDVQLPGTPHALVTADFDRDGVPDLAVFYCHPNNTCELERLRSRGDGTFADAQETALPGTSAPLKEGMMTAIDFNRDGYPDVALIADNRLVMVFTADAAGQLHLHSQFGLPSGSSPTSIAWGAISHRSLDLLVRVIDACGKTCGYGNTGYVYLNDGNGYFHVSAHIPLTPSSYGGLIGAADINGDHDPDVVALNSDPYNSLLEYAAGNGDGTFGAPVTVMPLPQAPNAPDVTNEPLSFVMRDIDRDSRVDLIYAGWDGIGDDMAGVFVLRNNNSAVNCTPPSPARLAVRVCLPAETSLTTSNPVRIMAAGNSPGGVKRLEIWADGKKAYQIYSDQMRTKVWLASGVHKITVVAVDILDSHVDSNPVYVTGH